MNDTSVPGHAAHQVVELSLYSAEIIENIGVVELQVVDGQGSRPVVHELGALVEESGIVFIRLHHKEV